jgi:hypothetical protein
MWSAAGCRSSACIGRTFACRWGVLGGTRRDRSIMTDTACFPHTSCCLCVASRVGFHTCVVVGGLCFLSPCQGVLIPTGVGLFLEPGLLLGKPLCICQESVSPLPWVCWQANRAAAHGVTFEPHHYVMLCLVFPTPCECFVQACANQAVQVSCAGVVHPCFGRQSTLLRERERAELVVGCCHSRFMDQKLSQAECRGRADRGTHM